MMVAWKDEYLIGVDPVDRQHRELFDRFHRFMDALTAGNARHELMETLGFLESYAEVHFRDEEVLQRQCHYPAAGFHRKAHETFRQKLSGLTASLAEQGVSNLLVIETGRTLFQWLVDHVCLMDREFASYLQQRVK